MAKRRKSLLDAFRAIPPKGASPRPAGEMPAPVVQPRPAPAVAPARAMAEGPAPARLAPVRAPPRVEPSAPRGTMSPDRKILIGLSVVTVLVLAGLYVKNQLGTDVVAGDGSTAGASASPGDGGRATPPALSTGNTADDRAFFDRNNRFTVRLAQYNNDEAGNQLARTTYKYLLGEGVPVVQPILSGDEAHIYMCAGAKPKTDELSALRDWVKSLRGPAGSKKTPYDSAYIDNIDHVSRR